ncbi:MAG: hypothetical protein LBK27_08625 [Treponema sp.]|jgi:hypothetical protein|nr:hypothetical protein [Treponema sp.]
MADVKDYQSRLVEALDQRREWLEKTELAGLKEELRTFQSAFSSLYAIYLKKGLINEDPYKHETKIGEIEIPETGAFNDTDRFEQLSIRLSNYDNQLDFLVNFYQFGVEFLNLDRLRRILGLVRYVDWVHLNPDAHAANTRAVAEITTQSKLGLDPIALSVINGALNNLSRATSAVMVILKELADYHKAYYKYEVRGAMGGMGAAEANAVSIRKKIATALPGMPFYPDLVEEILREDFSPEGPALRENVLKSLAVEAAKPRAVKARVSFKSILMEGVYVIAAINATVGEIGIKLVENETLLANRKKGFWEKVKDVLRQMMNKEPDEIIYELSYLDSTKGAMIKEKLDFHRFCAEMGHKQRILSGLGIHGPARGKLDAMTEDQITVFLEKTIRDVQSLYRTLTALDEFFKAETPREDRDKVKGIKPELAAIKNAIVRANQLRHEYSAQKEEEEQMRRLGISQGN